jgi:ABC-type uncharacterized transport system substrate-binding protein
MSLALVLGGGHKASAHPHLFIKSWSTFAFDNNTLKYVQLKWRFDPMFSSTLLKDYDKNGDQRFQKSEIRALQQEAFSNLRKHNYFSHLRINGREFRVRRVSSFYAYVIGGKYVVYRFRIPVGINLDSGKGTISLALYDPTYFCSIKHAGSHSVQIVGLNSARFRKEIRKRSSNYYYYGGMRITPKSAIVHYSLGS